MFVLCPHCQFLVGLDPRTGAPPASCPKCGGALDATGTDTPAAAAEAPAPALDAARAAATPELVDAPAPRPSIAPAPAPHPAPETTPAPEAAATGPNADDLVAAMAARSPRGVRKRPASDPPRHAATDTGRRRARAPTPAPVPSPAPDDASTAPAGDHRPRAAADGTASGGWWQRWRRRLARPAAAPAAGPAPAAVAPAPAPAGAPAEAPPDTAASASPSAAVPAAAGAAPHDSGTTTARAAAAAAAAPAARGWRGWRLRRNAPVPAAEPVPATPAPGASGSAATLLATADAEGAPATTPASSSAVASASAPAAAAAAPVEAAPPPPTAVPVEADTDAGPLPPPAAGPDPAHADAAPPADRAVSGNEGSASSAVAMPADPAPAAVAEVAPFIERRRPPEVIARDGAPPGHPLRRRTDAAPSFARAQAAPAQGGRRWFPLAVAAALSVLLVLQLLLAQRATLAADARWRPVVAGLCRALACTLPPWREPAAFTMLSRDVRAHPQVPGALLVDASFRNDARWPQPWPRVVLTLSNVEGRVVGARAFQARDYLGDESATTQTTLAPGQTAAIRLAIIEPAPDVVAFSFDFR